MSKPFFNPHPAIRAFQVSFFIVLAIVVLFFLFTTGGPERKPVDYTCFHGARVYSDHIEEGC